MKVLLVDPDHSRVPALQDALTAAGAEVAVAPSGAFALTMLERNRQDVIVSRARIDDMEGQELCEIIRSDPEARDVRFVLVAGQDELDRAQTATAGIDLIVPPSMDASHVLSVIVQLVRRDHERPVKAAPVSSPLDEAAVLEDAIVVTPEWTPESRASDQLVPIETTVAAEATPLPVTGTTASPPRPARRPASSSGTQLPSRTFQGSLGVMGIEELTQAIAFGGKTGRLIVALADGGGLVAFESGRVVHAEYGDASGEPAFAALVAVSCQERTGKFCFIPTEVSQLSGIPKTIAKSVDQLLLSAATELDSRTPAGAHTWVEER